MVLGDGVRAASVPASERVLRADRAAGRDLVRRQPARGPHHETVRVRATAPRPFDAVTNRPSIFVYVYSDLERVREGISSKFSMFTQYVSTFVFGLLVGFYTSPKLTAILLLVGPVIIGITASLSTVSSVYRRRVS